MFIVQKLIKETKTHKTTYWKEARVFNWTLEEKEKLLFARCEYEKRRNANESEEFI